MCCNSATLTGPSGGFSASKNSADKADALRLGAKEFIEKPTDLDEYTEAVWKMIWKWTKPPAPPAR